METVPPPGDLMLQFEFQSTVLLTLPQDCSLKKNSCEVLIFNLKFWKKHNVYIYIYMCVCAFFPLSLNLSLQGTVAMGALTEDVLAPISPTTGWCPFIAGIDWWLVETPPVEDGSSDPIPFSPSVISYGLKFKLVFFPKKKGGDISRSLYFSMGFPWTALKTK